MWLPCGFYYLPLLALVTTVWIPREPGGRGRIRTFVARKERQIYSLLVLATHPPVPVLVVQSFEKNFASRRDANSCPKIVQLKHLHRESTETQNGLVSKDTSPFNFKVGNYSASLPCLTSGGAGGGN